MIFFYIFYFRTANELVDYKIYTGRNEGLKLVLDAHTSNIASGSISDNFRGFHVVVDGKEKYPFTTRNGILLKTGQDNELIISATRFEADEGIRTVKPFKRNCYFMNEHPLRLHKIYTQSNCFFQCKIERVRDLLFNENKMEKRCVPWFYPVEDEYLHELCDPWQTVRFQKLLKAISDDECSGCLPDCISTKYKTTLSSAPLKHCDQTNLGVSPLCDLSTDNNLMMNPPMWRDAVEKEYLKFNGDDGLPDFIINKTGVKSNVRRYVALNRDVKNLVLRNQRETHLTYNALEEDITIVNFYFDESNIIQYNTFLRMTAIDFISSVGNLI